MAVQAPALRRVSCSPARVRNRCAFPLSGAWSITACAGSVAPLFEDDERKGRTEGPFVLSSVAEEASARSHGSECVSRQRHESQRRQETAR